MIGALAAETTNFLESNGEARTSTKRELNVAVNKEKVGEGTKITASDLLTDQFVLLQRGKKTYFMIKVV